MTTEALYRMDDATYRHLNDWCDSFYRMEESTAKCDAIIAMLEAMPAVDAEYSLSHGWQHVANLL
jgi:hypothetical protein